MWCPKKHSLYPEPSTCHHGTFVGGDVFLTRTGPPKHGRGMTSGRLRQTEQAQDCGKRTQRPLMLCGDDCPASPGRSPAAFYELCGLRRGQVRVGRARESTLGGKAGALVFSRNAACTDRLGTFWEIVPAPPRVLCGGLRRVLEQATHWVGACVCGSIVNVCFD